MQKRDFQVTNNLFDGNAQEMMQDAIFVYRYSARENTELQEIRKKYMPPSESKLDELKRLDNTVEKSGVIESLCVGICGSLSLTLGTFLFIEVLGNGILVNIFGFLLCFSGIVGILAAYPVYRKIYENAKARHSSRILELTVELIGK